MTDLGVSKIKIDSFGVSDVKNTIWFGRKTSHHLSNEQAEFLSLYKYHLELPLS